MTETVKTDLKDLIIEGIRNRKGHDITVVDLSGIESAAASYFIIAEGNSSTQTAAIAESVEEYVRVNSGLKPFGIDGADPGDWVIIDYGDTWVHIFLPEARNRYRLEELWSDASITEIPNLD
ncbi:MAG: ribosome silencing factor [Muribaculaceae bacterium]|nr:ribosome silencing factor [Muribaculaceae bacterium]MDE6611943.1 ribosome silencing factor [Muribaculaceae bacterium]